jgi:hypothetical protein
MKRNLQAILVIMVITFAKTTNAQNFGVNSPASNTSAALEVKSYPGLNQGVLIPSVALTSATDATTIPTPAATLMVYNTGTGGLTPAGYFYNAGTSALPSWVRIVPTQGTGTSGQVLTSTGASTLPTWSGPGKLSNIVTYTSGSGTYTVPTDVTSILVRLVGGGGAGGSANYSGCIGFYHSASGGGSGAYCENFYSSPSASYSFSVGAGGTANTTTCGSSAGGSGGSGGNTTFGSLSAGGGAGGRNSYDGFITAGGAGGTASGAQINISGARGGGATSTSYISSGYGANSIFGGGGSGLGVANGNVTGYPGTAPGAGGSGAISWNTGWQAGGAGAAGLIIIYEYK